jgi:hypothetical protein
MQEAGGSKPHRSPVRGFLPPASCPLAPSLRGSLPSHINVQPFDLLIQR